MAVQRSGGPTAKHFIFSKDNNYTAGWRTVLYLKDEPIQPGTQLFPRLSVLQIPLHHFYEVTISYMRKRFHLFENGIVPRAPLERCHIPRSRSHHVHSQIARERDRRDEMQFRSRCCVTTSFMVMRLGRNNTGPVDNLQTAHSRVTVCFDSDDKKILTVLI
uniref:SFRICE_029838 n=1 Tax=Spodoptera frugiperda TaxID=7108 RepID=A0A2H1VLI1_SPOFR